MRKRWDVFINHRSYSPADGVPLSLLKMFWRGTPPGERWQHGQMNYKDTKPYMKAFLEVDLLTDFAALCLTDFRDWRCTLSWLEFQTQLCELLTPCRRNYVLPLYCTFSLTASPLPKQNVQNIQCVAVGDGGDVELYCRPYPAGVLHSVSDQIQNLQNCFTTPNKNDQ